MYAIIEESGGQRKVIQGETILVDLIEGGEAKPGQAVTFDKVLVVGAPGGTKADGKTKLGTPYVKGASVSGEVVEPVVMGEKVYIIKYREKKDSKRKTGHRQRYTSVRVTAIAG
ncbi:MAG: 50S ribosomal protein L21 [Phycisphaerales bacterium]